MYGLKHLYSRRSQVLGRGDRGKHSVMFVRNSGLWKDNSDGKSCSTSFPGMFESEKKLLRQKKFNHSADML